MEGGGTANLERFNWIRSDPFNWIRTGALTRQPANFSPPLLQDYNARRAAFTRPTQRAQDVYSRQRLGPSCAAARLRLERLRAPRRVGARVVAAAQGGRRLRRRWPDKIGTVQKGAPAAARWARGRANLERCVLQTRRKALQSGILGSCMPPPLSPPQVSKLNQHVGGG